MLRLARLQYLARRLTVKQSNTYFKDKDKELKNA